MEIIILKQGMHDDKGAVEETKIINVVKPICSTVVLLKGEKNIIVDPGNLGFEDEILKELENNGLKPKDIDYVINTHTHFDHCYNNYLFKNAKIIAGDAVWYEKTVNCYDSCTDIKLPIEIIKTPGHFQKHISAVVKKEDKTYVIAGDAVTEQIIKSNDPQKLTEEYIQSAKKILDIADVIIPGHGPIIEGEKINELKELLNKTEEQ